MKTSYRNRARKRPRKTVSLTRFTAARRFCMKLAMSFLPHYKSSVDKRKKLGFHVARQFIVSETFNTGPCNCRGGPPWPPASPTECVCVEERAATEGRPYNLVSDICL